METQYLLQFCIENSHGALYIIRMVAIPYSPQSQNGCKRTEVYTAGKTMGGRGVLHFTYLLMLLLCLGNTTKAKINDGMGALICTEMYCKRVIQICLYVY